jgi:putative transposase
LKQIVEKYQTRASRLAEWLETNLPEGLTVFSFPEAHRRKLRTNNTLERLNRETCVEPVETLADAPGL